MKLLTKSLKWVTLEDIQVGEEIVAVDEFSPGGKGKARKLRTGIVEGKRTVYEEAYKLTTGDGRELILTGEHRMLSRLRKGNKNESFKNKYGKVKGKDPCGQWTFWREVKDFEIGDELRWITKPWKDGDGEDRWFGGIIDGEGSLRDPSKKHPIGVSVDQKVGPLFDSMELYLKRKGYHYCKYNDNRKNSDGNTTKFGNETIGKLTIDRIDEIFHIIGQTRPKRFIGVSWWEGRDLPGKRSGIGWAKVVSIEKLPKQEMIDLQTSEKTYIAEGFVSHNSTEIMGLFLHDTMFCPNTLSVIVAQTDKDASDLFERAHFMFESIPEVFKPSVGRSNVRELKFDRLNSKFTIGSAEAKHFGISKTINNLHITEMSHPYYKEDFIIGLLETVPRSGRIVLESTARGEGNIFHRYYLGAKHKENEFANHYYRWFEHDEYQIPLLLGEKIILNEEEVDLVNKYAKYFTHHSRLPKIKWRREKKSRLGKLFIQEYPEDTDEDSFIKSGSPVLDVDLLKARDKELPGQLPQEIWLGGELYLHRIAAQGARYIIGCDTSEGDINSDYSAAMVIRSFPPPVEQVALLHGRWTPDIFSEKIYKIGRAYNDALMVVERNNHGHAVLLNLTNGIVRNGIVKYPTYPNIYVGPDKKFGWLTGINKVSMIQELSQAIRTGQLVVASKKFIEEACKFSYLGGNKMGAPSGSHDDIVMAQALALMGALMGNFSVEFI